jgi:ubiquinone/menaquinone biosynthesis C-methylase UbiE
MADTMASTRTRASRIGRRPDLAVAGGRVEALGYLDTVVVEDAPKTGLEKLFSRVGRALAPDQATQPGRGILRIEGWAASAGAGPADQFAIQYAGESLTPSKMELGLPSLDVQGLVPHLPMAGRCRFRLQVPLTKAQRAKTRGAVVSCSPLFQGQAGCVLARIVEPVISPASQADSNYVGAGDFLDVSNEFLGHLIHKCGLKPDDDVLDAGCGLGRIAYSLAHYLAPTARYEGFDIVDDLINWASRTISTQCPNFTFRKVNVYNKWYNPAGTVSSTELRFPYDDASFDVIFLTSVFTHMLGAEIRNYLNEMHRVLKPGGRCLCTCFLRIPESINLIQAGKSSQNLVHPVGEGYTTNPEIPEDAIGFDESLMMQWIESRGFTVAAKYYGSWCGRPITTSYQDILILEKK